MLHFSVFLSLKSKCTHPKHYQVLFFYVQTTNIVLALLSCNEKQNLQLLIMWVTSTLLKCSERNRSCWHYDKLQDRVSDYSMSFFYAYVSELDKSWNIDYFIDDHLTFTKGVFRENCRKKSMNILLVFSFYLSYWKWLLL